MSGLDTDMSGLYTGLGFFFGRRGMWHLYWDVGVFDTLKCDV